MIITRKFTMALDRRGVAPVVDAVQDDGLTRAVEITLTYENQPWQIPDGTTAAVRFKKPDGKSGLYDTLPNDESAYTISGNVVTVVLAPEVLTAEGDVKAAVALYRGNDVLGTFPFVINVASNPAAGQSISNNYYYLQTWNDVNDAIARIDGAMVTSVNNITPDANGNVDVMSMACTKELPMVVLEGMTGQILLENFNRAPKIGEVFSAICGKRYTILEVVGVTDYTCAAKALASVEMGAVKTVNGIAPDLNGNVEIKAGGGITKEEKNLILAIFRALPYTADVAAIYSQLEALWSVSHKASYNLTGATASNNASAVVENGAYSTTLTAESGYTLTGATVKVTMDGVDITSEAYKNGVITIASVTGAVVISVVAKEVPSYAITNNLTNVTTDNSATKVTEGDFYSANLSWDATYSLDSIVITMGGVDVTADVYGEGKILITEVTGDVVITAVAEEPVPVEMVSFAPSATTKYYSTADNTTLLINTSYAGAALLLSNAATKNEAELTVIIKNETEDAIEVGNLPCGAMPRTILGTSSDHLSVYNAVYGIKLSSAMQPGDSYSFKYTLPADNYFAVKHISGLTYEVSGGMDITEPVAEYATTENIVGTNTTYYSDGGETTLTTMNYGRRYYTAAFEEDTTLRIVFTNSATRYAGAIVGCMTPGTETAAGGKVYFAKKTNERVYPGIQWEMEYTVKAGYAFMSNSADIIIMKA